MKALSLATTSKDKNTLDAKCKEWLTKAEKIKEAKDWRAAARSRDSSSTFPTPASSRALTTREEIILLEGAKLNGFKFPPWKADPSPEEFEPRADRDGLFMYVCCPLLASI